MPDVRKSVHSQSAADATVCVCVYMFFKHLLVQHLCSHVVLFCAILMQAFHSPQPYTNACDIWLFTTHLRFSFHFFRLLFMLHDCSEWRRHSLHLSAVVLGFLPLFRHISVLLCVIFITKMNTTYLQKYNAIQWWLLCVSVVVNFHELWLSDCVSTEHPFFWIFACS